MIKNCPMCGADFNAQKHQQKYCSRTCARNAQRKQQRSYEFSKAVRGKPKQKTYAQIRAANRAHPIESGWRGQPCMGGKAASRANVKGALQ